MEKNIIVATVLYNLISKGYILSPSSETNEDQVIFNVTHPKWDLSCSDTNFQVVQIYGDTISTGRDGCTRAAE